MKSVTYIVEKISVIFVVCLFTLSAVACTVTQSIEDPVAFEGQALNTAQAPIPQNTLPSLPHEELDLSGYPEPVSGFPASQPTIYPTFSPPPKCNITISSASILSEQAPSYLSFSEPVIVATTDEWFSLAQWLPDSQKLLATRETNGFETIFVLNTETGETTEYAKRNNLSNTPIWLNQPNGVAFVESTLDGWVLQFSSQTEINTIAKNLASVHLAKAPSKEKITYLFSLEPSALLNIDAFGHAEAITNMPLNVKTPQVASSSDLGHKLAWSSDGKWLLQYLKEEVFLINIISQEICSIDLGDYGELGQGEIGNAQWSYDNSYLSFFIKPQFSLSAQLYLLNIKSMELAPLSFPKELSLSQIGAYVWSPNQNLILLQNGYINDQTEQVRVEWRLVDPLKKGFTNILPNYTTLPGGGYIIWSSDGKKVAYHCPTQKESNICLLNISQ